mmetsp:Transcript_35179/g.105123  ORF Transcript_35179/g.105123 Transcript_35179/m.105123 type:complete len:278 (-) Transcript_35179:339-1172(-)
MRAPRDAGEGGGGAAALYRPTAPHRTALTPGLPPVFAPRPSQESCRTSTTSEVMLSIEPRTEARSQRAEAAVIASGARKTTFAHCCSSTTSHSPSDASTKKASDGPSSYVLISGSAVTPYRFRWQSPNARETARSPCTRQHPAKMTCPPAASTLALSSGRLGLWSSESGLALPSAWTIAARESPTLTTIRRRLPPGVAGRRRMQQMPVEPSGIAFCTACLTNSPSVASHASTHARATSSSPSCAPPFRSTAETMYACSLGRRWPLAHAAARLPPCPS